jgi:hypothetical protein
VGRQSNTSDEQRKAFSVALKAAMAAAGIESAAQLHRRALVAGVDKTASAVGHWTTGYSEPSRPEVLVIEEICEVEPGHLSRHLGWIPVGINYETTIEQLILADRDLTDANKATLLGLIEQLRRS